MKIIGNPSVWLRIGKERPTVALLHGPDGVGRFTNSKLIASAFSTSTLFLEALRVSEAEELLSFFATMSSNLKIAIINPENHSQAGWDRLLTLLEDLPPRSHVWIVDNGSIPESIHTRAMHYEFGPLTTKEIKQVFDQTEGEGDHFLDLEAISVNDAALSKELQPLSSPIVAWIRAIESSSREELLRSLRGWTAKHSQLLEQELIRQASGDSKFTYPLTGVRTELILAALESLYCQNPKLGATSAGMYLLEYV